LSATPVTGPGANVGMGAVLQKDGCVLRIFVTRFKFRWYHSASRIRKIEIIFTAFKRTSSLRAVGGKVAVYSPKYIFRLEFIEYNKNYILEISGID
jgi:hypothetical protein